MDGIHLLSEETLQKPKKLVCQLDPYVTFEKRDLSRRGNRVNGILKQPSFKVQLDTIAFKASHVVWLLYYLIHIYVRPFYPVVDPS